MTPTTVAADSLSSLPRAILSLTGFFRPGLLLRLVGFTAFSIIAFAGTAGAAGWLLIQQYQLDIRYWAMPLVLAIIGYGFFGMHFGLTMSFTGALRNYLNIWKKELVPVIDPLVRAMLAKLPEGWIEIARAREMAEELAARLSRDAGAIEGEQGLPCRCRRLIFRFAVKPAVEGLRESVAGEFLGDLTDAGQTHVTQDHLRAFAVAKISDSVATALANRLEAMRRPLRVVGMVLVGIPGGLLVAAALG